ncbi:MAG: hypothetical protein ACOX6J_03815 [Oscillospiraceae bacterium]
MENRKPRDDDAELDREIKRLRILRGVLLAAAAVLAAVFSHLTARRIELAEGMEEVSPGDHLLLTGLIFLGAAAACALVYLLAMWIAGISDRRNGGGE